MAYPMDTSVADALEQLASVKAQQLASVNGIAALEAQHRHWQSHVSELLGRIDRRLREVPESARPSPEVLFTFAEQHDTTMETETVKIQSKGNASMPMQVSAPLVRSCGDSGNLDENEEVETSDTDASLQNAHDKPNEHVQEVAAPDQRRFGTIASRPSSRNTLEEIFRTRKTVVPKDGQPTLNSIVLEEMASNAKSEAPPEGDMWAEFRRKAAKIANSSWFEYASGFVIMLNLATIGVEAELSLERGEEFGAESWPYLVERLFLAVYFVEAVARALASGWSACRDGWFLMDEGPHLGCIQGVMTPRASLVCVGLLTLLVVPSFGANELQSVEKLLIVRGLRLLRLLRALRMVSHFKIMWRLVHGLLTSAETILAVTLLLLVCLFVAACVAVEVIAKDEDLKKHDQLTMFVIDEYFSSLMVAVMTLMQFVTMDSLATIYFPLIEARPYLVLFFLPLLIFISIGLMNLVTAALVENAMKHQAEQEEQHKLQLKAKVREAMPTLINIFQTLDKDNSGNVTQEELRHVPVDVLPPKVLQALCADTWEELFEYLDVDGTGTLSQAEFVEGLLNLCLLDMPIATVQTLKLLQLIRAHIVNIGDRLAAFNVQPQPVAASTQNLTGM
ncbi:SCN1A [Symbiodinium microadriaticum]|nr:SCN1A [Symbiodinium microadriaticum]CAE7944727.1 SCN1A [Symbiodinium sp. KB8]